MDQWMKPRVELGWTLASQMPDSNFCALSLDQPLCPSAVLPVDLCPSPHIKGSRQGFWRMGGRNHRGQPNFQTQCPKALPVLLLPSLMEELVFPHSGVTPEGHWGPPGSEPGEDTWYRAPTKPRHSWSHLRVPQVTTQDPGQDCPPCRGPCRPEIFVCLLVCLLIHLK